MATFRRNLTRPAAAPQFARWKGKHRRQPVDSADAHWAIAGSSADIERRGSSSSAVGGTTGASDGAQARVRFTLTVDMAVSLKSWLASQIYL
jgi:hypothetical protein